MNLENLHDVSCSGQGTEAVKVAPEVWWPAPGFCLRISSIGSQALHGDDTTGGGLQCLLIVRDLGWDVLRGCVHPLLIQMYDGSFPQERPHREPLSGAGIFLKCQSEKLLRRLRERPDAGSRCTHWWGVGWWQSQLEKRKGLLSGGQ